MADVKKLQTRIALKYDTYANWTDESKGANLVLLKGEIGICEIPSGNTAATTAPTVLFKVGDGETPFKTLKWASALAADVYEWAKAKTVAVETIKVGDVNKEYLVFRDAAGAEIANSRVDLSKFALASDVASVTSALEGRIAAVEGSIGTGSVATDINNIKGRLDVIEGDEEGSIAYAVAEAVDALEDYADQAEADAISTVVGTANDAKTANTVYGAKAFATDLNTAMDTRVGILEGTVAGHTTAIGENATAIGTVRTDFEAADRAINAKIGTLPTGEGAYADVVAGIEAAKQAGINAANTVQGNLNTLSGTVSQNATDISTNAGNIAANAEAIEANAAAIETLVGSDADKSVRDIAAEETAKIVAGAHEDYDTLKEIADFIRNDSTGAAGMSNAIAQNAEDIEALEGRMDTAESDIDALEGRASSVEGRMTTAEGEIDTLQGEMTQAQTDITNLGSNKLDASVFNAFNDGTSKKVSDIEADIVAKANAAQAAAEGTAASALAEAVGTINGKIAALEGADSALDGKISANATSIQTNATNIANEESARKAADEAIEKKIGGSYSETATVEMAIADAKKAGTDAAGVASANAGRLSTIESDYLKAADLFIIDCGSATEVIHELPKA